MKVLLTVAAAYAAGVQAIQNAESLEEGLKTYGGNYGGFGSYKVDDDEGNTETVTFTYMLDLPSDGNGKGKVKLDYCGPEAFANDSLNTVIQVVPEDSEIRSDKGYAQLTMSNDIQSEDDVGGDDLKKYFKDSGLIGDPFLSCEFVKGGKADDGKKTLTMAFKTIPEEEAEVIKEVEANFKEGENGGAKPADGAADGAEDDSEKPKDGSRRLMQEKPDADAEKPKDDAEKPKEGDAEKKPEAMPGMATEGEAKEGGGDKLTDEERHCPASFPEDGERTADTFVIVLTEGAQPKCSDHPMHPGKEHAGATDAEGGEDAAGADAEGSE